MKPKPEHAPKQQELDLTWWIFSAMILGFIALLFFVLPSTHQNLTTPSMVPQAAQAPMVKPVMGVISLHVNNPVVTFYCRDWRGDDRWRVNTTLLYVINEHPVVSVAESSAFTYRLEEDELLPKEFVTEAHLAERYANTTHADFECIGDFPKDLATVTTWMQGRKQEREMHSYHQHDSG